MATFDTPTSTNADLAWESLSAKQRLANLRQAIRKLEIGGQQYSINGRSFMRAQLATYYDEQRHLEKLVAESESVTGTLTALGRFESQR